MQSLTIRTPAQIPHVDGLEAYIRRFPGRVVHSKYYRSPDVYRGQRVLTIGNSASGFDIMNELTTTARLPVYSSRRHRSPFEGDVPGPGIAWKPVVARYREADGAVEFADGTVLGADEVDRVVYCTGYRPSFPFWNARRNGRELYDYDAGKLVATYWHTFFSDLGTLAVVGIQKALTFRSFEYQAVALARLFAGRSALPLPPPREMRRWEEDRLRWVRETGRKFHDVESEPGKMGSDTLVWLGFLYKMAGLGTLSGDGRLPPVLSKEMLHALKTIRKYPQPGDGSDDGEKRVEYRGEGEDIADKCMNVEGNKDESEWVMITRNRD